jgi:hypothetical protein
MISSSKGDGVRTVGLVHGVQIFILIDASTRSCSAVTDELEEIVNLRLVGDATDIV